MPLRNSRPNGQEYVELDVTQKIAGDYLGGTIYFSAGEYTGDVMMDFMCNTAVNIYKGNEVIFRHYDRHWRFPDDGLDDVTSDYKIHNPAIDWIKENYGGFCYSTLSYADDCSKKCPDVRWEIYNTCDDSWASVNWTVTNLIRTAENDGYECDATAYFESNGQKIEREESEPCFHVVTLDKDPINAMKVIYNGEHTKLSPSPASRDRLRSRAPLSRRGSQRAITTSSPVEPLQSNQDTIEAKRSSPQ